MLFQTPRRLPTRDEQAQYEREFRNELKSDLPRRLKEYQDAAEKQYEYLQSILTEEQFVRLRVLGQDVAIKRQIYETALKY